MEASDADEALTVLQQNSDVHLVFSDVNMPGSMDGLELARLVNEQWPHIHLLLTSGHHRLRDAEVPGDGTFRQEAGDIRNVDRAHPGSRTLRRAIDR